LRTTFEILKNNPIFQGIAFTDFEQVLNCLSANTASYKKNDFILTTGEAVNFVGLVLSGSVQVIKEDMEGHISIITELGASEVFAEVFACAEITKSPFTVLAVEDSEILLMNYKRILSTCTSACPFHAKLIENMLRLIARKNIMLHQKNEILSKRTTREKLLAFFEMQRGAERTFTIPYNREELAQYLCVDRSAMSSELCKMRDQGIIKFHRSAFEML